MAGLEVPKPVEQGALEYEPNESPLVIDWDSILKTNLSIESLLVFLKQKPLCLFLLPFWWLKGVAFLKRQIADRVELDVRVLPYRPELLNFLRSERERGRTILLKTSADRILARRVADYLGVFAPFVGDDNAISAATQRWVAGEDQTTRHPAEFLKPLRLHHWVKNLLLFVPVLAAHQYFDAGQIGRAILAFVAFGLCASAGYVLNDLLDLASDRHHPQKRFRSFAAGTLPLSYGLGIIPVLVVLGSIIALALSPLFLGMLWLYLVLTMTYSLSVRRVVILDVIVLAGLYSMRIMAGSAAVALWPSEWLLAFSTFMFLSLALVKRYGELVIMRTVDGEQAKSRGYELSDGELLAAMGVASGYVAVLVLALYVDSDAAHNLYGRSGLIWFLCPLLLYGISRIWLIAHRGNMPGDPVVFAMRDRVSRILIALVAIDLVLAL